jgi:hypothetical protein
MKNQTYLSFVTAFLAVCIFAIGCQDPPADSHDHGDSHGDHDHDGHDHDGHSHDHDGHDHGSHDHPAHGPNHGHIFDFDSPDFKGEWCKYKDNDVIRMYILDGKGEAPKPLAVDSFVVKPQVGNDGAAFELEAENVDPEGAAHSFMLDDKLFQMAIPTGVTIEVTAGDTVLKGEIKAHEPLDH